MKGEQYLTNPRQYAQVYSKGKAWSSDLLIMRAMPNGLTLSRYGFSISKRVGGAVVRNHLKRRMREILRVMPLAPGWDIVFIARPAAAETDFQALKKSVENLLSRGKMVNTEPDSGCKREFHGEALGVSRV